MGYIRSSQSVWAEPDSLALTFAEIQISVFTHFLPIILSANLTKEEHLRSLKIEFGKRTIEVKGSGEISSRWRNFLRPFVSIGMRYQYKKEGVKMDQYSATVILRRRGLPKIEHGINFPESDNKELFVGVT